MSGAIAPNPTLYINNLNDKVNKEELRAQLLALFISYGRVVDIVAKKGSKMKGQAFIAFADLAEATTAMRACEGTMFYDKPLHIHYAKTKSYALIKREDPDFVPPNPAGGSRQQNGPSTSNGVEKRSREEDADATARQVKREKPSGDEDGDEMELEDENDEESQQTAQSMPPAQAQPSARLFCSDLPLEVTDDVLGVLFQQYRGFISAQVGQATTNDAGQKVKAAQVHYETAELATVARDALDGFTLKKGWNMSVAYF